MNPVSFCSKCGTTLPADAPSGLCPRCVIAMNFATQTVVTGEPVAIEPLLLPEEVAPHFPQFDSFF